MPPLTREQRKALRPFARDMLQAIWDEQQGVLGLARLNNGRFKGTKRVVSIDTIKEEQATENSITILQINLEDVRKSAAGKVADYMSQQFPALDPASRAKFMADLGITQNVEGESTETYTVEPKKPYDVFVGAQTRCDQIDMLLAEAYLAAREDSRQADRVIALSLLRNTAYNKKRIAERRIRNGYMVANGQAISRAKRELAEQARSSFILENVVALERVWERISMLALNSPVAVEESLKTLILRMVEHGQGKRKKRETMASLREKAREEALRQAEQAKAEAKQTLENLSGKSQQPQTPRAV